MDINKALFDELLGDGKVEEYKEKYYEKYGKNAPPFCLWDEESIDEYKEKLRKAVEE